MYSLISKIYGGLINRRNKKFDSGKNIARVDVPVISVGNISMGGTGKTPFVQLLAKELLSSKKVGIVSRGYKRRSRGIVEVSNGEHIAVDVDQSGDELQLLACSIPAAVCVAAENRFHGATRIIRKYGVECIILDDGFQHRQLHRDFDIVLIDRATLDSPNIMPIGRLREPLASLQRADVVVCMNDVAKSEVLMYCSDKTLVVSATTVNKGFTQLDVKHVANKPEKAVAVCGIANPERFKQALKLEGVEVVGSRAFRDHHAYFQNDIAELTSLCKKENAHVIVTTQKDAVKLQRYESYFNDNNIELCALEIVTDLGTDAKLFRTALALHITQLPS